MTRDVRYTLIPVKVERYDAVTGTRYSTTTYQHVAIDTGRADAVSTVESPWPLVRPTNYWAHYFAGQSYDYSYVYRSTTGKYEYRGQSTDVNWTVANLETYGCNPASKLPEVSASAISAMEARLRSRVQDNDWNLGQSIAEIPEAVGFIVDVVKGLTKALSALKKGNYVAVAGVMDDILKGKPSLELFTPTIAAGSVSRYLKPVVYPRYTTPSNKKRWNRARRVAAGSRGNLAKAWLAYKFAWLPLLADAYNVAQAINEGLSDPKGFSVHAEVLDNLPFPPIKGGIAMVDINSSNLGKRGVKGEVCFGITNPTLFSLDRYGLLDPLSIAWELVPLSFVVDWFLPIGRFLNGLHQPFGLSFKFGYRTTYVEWDLFVKFRFENNTFVGGVIPAYGAKLSAMNRQIYLGFPAPTPQFRGFGSLSMGQSLTLLALTAR